MRLNRIKPVSYFEANLTKIVADVCEVGESMVITVDGEAKAVLQDVISYDRMQQTIALLQILLMAQSDIAHGRYSPADEVFERLRAKLANRDKSPT